MKKFSHLIKSQCGETLLEALVAILVIAFSGLTLYFSVITSARVNAAATVADDAFRTETNAAEQQSSITSTGKVTITSSDGFNVAVDVDYTGASSQLVSYQLNGD